MQAQQAHIDQSAALLAAGGVVAFPTETVYGLGADALNPAAVARVFEIKGRPSNNPLIVHVDGPAMARPLVAEWPEAAQKLAEAFWPGPLSIVLPKSAAVPSIVTAGGPNVALRAPDHPVALAFIRALGRPIVGPSANPSGSVSPTTAEHVRSAFGERVPVLDGGACTRGIESTVISLVGEPRVLRPGLISAAQLSQVLGRPVAESSEHASAGSDGPMESPGMLSKHYAPTTPAERFTGDQWPLLRRELASRAREVVVLSHINRPVDQPHTFVAMPRDPEQYAARLYAALREADELQASLIAIEVPDGQRDQDPKWRAIHDRLNRATVEMFIPARPARDVSALDPGGVGVNSRGRSPRKGAQSDSTPEGSA